MVMVPRADERLDGHHRQPVGHDHPGALNGKEEGEVKQGDGEEDRHGKAVRLVSENLQQRALRCKQP